MTVSAAAYATLEQLFNQAIRLDPETPRRLAPMHGRVIEIQLTGLAISLYLIPEPNGIQLLSQFEGEPDCTLRGSPLDLTRMRGTRESADQLFSGNVEISGDHRLAQQFGDFLSGLDLDWEEQLSKFTGDLLAHEIGTSARSLFGWAGDPDVRGAVWTDKGLASEGVAFEELRTAVVKAVGQDISSVEQE